MPVGTFGGVRHVSHEDLEAQDTPIMLANAYHLYLRPGPERLERLGGFHRFAHWNRPLLTDSGGFQIFSLPHKREIFESSVRFKSYIDNAFHDLSPESITHFQHIVGSDIMMVLDVCVPSTSPRDQAAWAMNQTHHWAKRSRDAFRPETGQLQFAICQGAVFEDLRRESAGYIAELGFEGHAIGGLAVGESREEREHFTALAASVLPEDKPRYLMGVGTPHDLVRAVRDGVDMFDCIIPTNHAKQGVAYTWQGKVKLRRLAHAEEQKPVDESCSCSVCKRYTRAYLHQMLKSSEPSAWRYLSLHNLWFYRALMDRMQQTIANGTFASFAKSFLGDVPET
jgi:queuine tRNA-ribosyltransferase